MTTVGDSKVRNNRFSQKQINCFLQILGVLLSRTPNGPKNERSLITVLEDEDEKFALDLFKLRAINYSSKTIVSGFLPNQKQEYVFSVYLSPDYTPLKKIDEVVRLAERFQCPGDKQNSFNPFRVGYLKIEFSMNGENASEIEARNIWQAQLLRLLELCGHHLRKLKFVSEDKVNVSFLRYLRLCLQSTPNLEYLEVDFFGCVGCYDTPNMNDYMQESPIPLKNLKVLSCDNTPRVFALSLLKGCQRNVEKFSFFMNDVMDDEALPNINWRLEEKIELDQLKNLNIRWYKESSGAAINIIQNLGCPIVETLQLTLAWNGDVTNVVDCETLFTTLNGFHTVKSLDLGLHNTFLALPTCIGLRLPVLEHLEIWINGDWKTKAIDFILPSKFCKTIQIYGLLNSQLNENSLQWEVVSSSSPQENHIIQFSGFECRMYDSNIWKLFPHLESLVIGVSPLVDSHKAFYTRTEYLETINSIQES